MRESLGLHKLIIVFSVPEDLNFQMRQHQEMQMPEQTT